MGNLSLNFSDHEFACRCGCGESNLAPVTILMLQEMRDGYGRSITPNSVTRCIAHNKAEGGRDNSAHLTGVNGFSYAVDIPYTNARELWKLVRLAIKAGFTRIGVYKTFIHVDNAPDKTAMVMWHGK